MGKRVVKSPPKGDRRCFALKGITLLCVCFLLSLPSNVKAQQSDSAKILAQKVTYTTKGTPLVEVLKELKEKTNVRFTYNTTQIRKQSPVTVSVKNVPFGDLLNRILAKTHLSYTISMGGVVIFEDKKETTGPSKKVKLKDVMVILRGQVKSKNGEPLAGVTIKVLSTKEMTSTTNDGIFEIIAQPDRDIHLSMVGMKDRFYRVKESDQNGFVSLEMDSSVHIIEDVVINGYQTMDKRQVVGATYKLDPVEFLQAGATSVDQMLQGKVPGLIAINRSGSPTASPKLRIRGTSTIVGNASPVWVVDGVVREDPVNLSALQINQALSGAQSSNFNIVGNAISGINPYDIESITFLKDASATAIYGVKAANGVIVVKTKRGKAGPAIINYNTQLGFTGRPNYNNINAMNAAQRIDVSREAMKKGTFYPFRPNPSSYEGLIRQLYDRQITQSEFSRKVAQLETMNTDWLDLLAGNQFNQGHTISISGGADKSTFYVSLGYQDMSGTFTGDNLKSYTMMSNVQGEINRKLSYRINVNASLRNANGFLQGVNPSDYALKTSRAIAADEPYIAGYSPVLYKRSGGFLLDPQPLKYSIFNELATTGNSNSGQSIQATASLTYRFLPGFSYEGLFSGAMSNNRSFQYAEDASFFMAKYRGYDNDYPVNAEIQAASSFPFGGIAYPSNTSIITYTARNTLSFNKSLFGNRDRLSLAVIQEIRSTKSDGLTSQELGYYPNRGNTYFSSYYNNNPPKFDYPQHTVQQTNSLVNTLSYIGTASYMLDNKYVLNANIRTDGSNRFGQYANQRFLPNWSVGVMWHVADESWFDNTNLINQLNLRMDYGTQGNVVTEVGPNLIASYPKYPLTPGSNAYVLDLKSLPYPDLQWEKTSGWDIGVDMTLFKGRVSLSADAYDKKGSNLLVAKNIPVEYGIEQMYQNYGHMSNKGWEGTLTVIPVRNKKFTWTQQFVYSQVNNQVTKSDLKYTYQDYIGGNVILPGKPIGAFYSYIFSGLNSQYGTPQYDLKGADKQLLESPADFLAYSGRSDPAFTIGTSTQLRYGNFSLSANFYLALGNYHRLNNIYSSLNTDNNAGIPSPDQNLPRELADRWRQPGDEQHTTIPAFTNWFDEVGMVKFYAAMARLSSGSSGGDLIAISQSLSPYSMYDLSTARVANASYLRCQSMMLSYMLPAVATKSLGVKGGNINFTVNNPFVIKSKEMRWQDPENEGVGMGTMPTMVSYYITAGITF